MSNDKANSLSQSKTVGEQVFEKYLDSLGFTYKFEKLFSHTDTKPDYSLTYLNTEYLIEIKDFENKKFTVPIPFGYGDPYRRIRKKIDEGRKKFRNFKEYPCFLVLCDVDGSGRQIHQPEIVQGAMFGDIGLQVPVPAIGNERGDQSSISATQVFTTRGKMMQPGWKGASNTTIGALVVISTYENLNLGVRVYENPFARKHSEFKSIFSGEFDEIYGVLGGYYCLLYQGLGLREYSDI